jgi:hypothetical protein
MKIKWKNLLLYICVLGLIALGGYGLGNAVSANFEQAQTGDPNLLWLVAVSVLAMYLALLTHELGHLLAGRLAGMRPFLLISGPFKVMATQTGLELGWNTSLALAGGLSACLPGKDGNLRRQHLMLVAGGPLSSLLTGLLALAGYWLLPKGSCLGLPILVYGVAGLSICLATLLPAKTSGFMTDGAQLLSLWRGGQDVEEQMALLLLQAESLSGTRPRDLSPELLQRVSSAPAGSLTGISANMLVYTHALDGGDPITAGAALQRAVEQNAHIPEGIRQAIFLEQAYYLAAHQHEVGQAEEALRKGLASGLVEKHTRLRCQAAVLWAQGNSSQAAALAEQARNFAQRSMDPGSAQAEMEWLEQLLTDKK